MRVLVTGATGFVGASLTRRLVNSGKEVHVFTRQTTDLWRIKDILKRVRRYDVDLRDADKVETYVADIRPTVIFHLATFGGFSSQVDSANILDSNFKGTAHLLRACEKTGFDCFVNTGSSSEYGMKMSPMAEIDRLEPLGDYGVAKAAATLFCRSEAIRKGLPVVTLRLFSPYGPWDDPKRLIPYVITSLLKGEAPELSTPSSVRDYVYIDDVLEMYLKLSENFVAPGDIINVGSGSQSSIGEVVSLLAEIVGNGMEPASGTLESRKNEPEKWVADIGKAKALTGWEPSTLLESGLRKTVAWFRDNVDLYR
jgi:nucleoside-diphosphate-sugar epimerase